MIISGAVRRFGAIESGAVWSIVSNGSSQASPIFLSEDGAWPRAISADNELVFTLNHGSGHAAYALNLNSQNQSITHVFLPQILVNLIHI